MKMLPLPPPFPVKSRDTGRAFGAAMHADFIRDTKRYFVTLPFTQSRVLVVLEPKEEGREYRV